MITMISKSIAFLVAALMLANCCALGNGCVPAAGSPVAWDGLGAAPTDDTFLEQFAGMKTRFDPKRR